jgi:N-acetylglutamate synthase-like GNAT family acetyltransferase
LEAVVAEAKGLKLPKIYLYTIDKTAFYARCGWAILEQEVMGETTAVILYKNI